ncbi:MAG: protein-export chaperone SecB [Gammaproteobacteria bacterium]
MSENTQQPNNHGTFSIHNLYIKDVSFEAPNSPFIFQDNWQPKVDFDFGLDHESLKEQELYEVTLSFTVTVKNADKTAFLVEAKQAGVFQITNFKPNEIEEIISTTCPTILFPYVRELISGLVIKGGFPSLLIPPVNFDALYMQHLERQRNPNSNVVNLSEIQGA